MKKRKKKKLSTFSPDFASEIASLAESVLGFPKLLVPNTFVKYSASDVENDASKLKFTWKVVNITENKVVFKLNFTDPSFISPLVT